MLTKSMDCLGAGIHPRDTVKGGKKGGWRKPEGRGGEGGGKEGMLQAAFRYSAKGVDDAGKASPKFFWS